MCYFLSKLIALFTELIATFHRAFWHFSLSLRPLFTELIATFHKAQCHFSLSLRPLFTEFSASFHRTQSQFSKSLVPVFTELSDNCLRAYKVIVILFLEVSVAFQQVKDTSQILPKDFAERTKQLILKLLFSFRFVDRKVNNPIPV